MWGAEGHAPVFLNDSRIFWRRERDSNPRYPFGYNGFQDRRHQPLGHPSAPFRSYPIARGLNPEVHEDGFTNRNGAESPQFFVLSRERLLDILNFAGPARTACE